MHNTFTLPALFLALLSDSCVFRGVLVVLGDFTGWIGYTWSKTERKFLDLNNGVVFPAKYDRRHDLTVVASYKLNDRWTFGASFIYATWFITDAEALS